MAETRIPRTLWPFLTLMVVSIAINYVDRVTLSTAAPLLKDELELSPGTTPTKVRKTCTAAGLGFSTVILAVVVVPNQSASMVFLMLAYVFVLGPVAPAVWRESRQ